jgi:predicted amidohydrolase YtcJ
MAGLEPDLILSKGNILTVDKKNPRCEAVAIRDEKIAGVGSNLEIEGLKGPGTKIIDLKGKTVLPGFIDPHQHLLSYGITMKTWIDLSGTSWKEDICERVAERVKSFPKGRWILGRGWNEEAGGRELPTRWDLDKVAPDNPLALKDISGHYGLANSLALKLGGVTRDTPQPKVGWIDKDSKTGEPVGILREAAMNFVWNVNPPPSYAEILEAVEMGCHRANSLGLTSVHTVGIPLPQGVGYTAEELRAYLDLKLSGRLTVRTYLLIPVCRYFHKAGEEIMLDHQIGLGLKTGFGDSLLKIGPAKIFVDGSLNARSAALYEPYSDNPSTSGMMFYSQEELDSLVMKAHRAGFQLAIHAHGDRAIDVTLNSLEKALKEFPRENHRHRIKHVELLNDERIERIRKLGLIVTGIPTPAGFSPWFQEMARVRVGEKRAKYLHRYKDVMASGTLVVGGTDGHPVGKYLAPLQGLRDRVRVAGFTLEEALAIQTINSAHASFEEEVKGSIATRKLADLVVLAENPFAVDIDHVPDIRVEKTILGGKIIYENPASAESRGGKG